MSCQIYAAWSCWREETFLFCSRPRSRVRHVWDALNNPVLHVVTKLLILQSTVCWRWFGQLVKQLAVWSIRQTLMLLISWSRTKHETGHSQNSNSDDDILLFILFNKRNEASWTQMCSRGLRVMCWMCPWLVGLETPALAADSWSRGARVWRDVWFAAKQQSRKKTSVVCVCWLV